MQVDSYTETDFKDTEIGPIPTDWEAVPLQQLGYKFYGGGTPSTKRSEYWNGNIAWVTSAYIDDRIFLNRCAGYITLAGLENSSSQLVEKGNLLIGTRVGVGKVAINLLDTAISQDLTAMIVNREKADIQFLAYAIKSDRVQDSILSGARGTTIKGIPRADLIRTYIPLPPLPEQRRIAAVLNAIQDAIAAQDDIIAAARELKRSLMQRLFTYGPGSEPAETKETEIGEIPAHWEVTSLGNVITLQRGYDLPTAMRQAGTVPVVSSSGVSGTHIEARVRAPGVVTGRYGTIGEVHYLEQDFWPLNTTLFVNNFKNNQPRFVAYLLSRVALSGLNDKTSVPGINRNHAHQLLVALPPVEEQRAITHHLLQIDAKITVEEDRKAALQDFFKSMLHQLMTGHIRLLTDEGIPGVNA